MSGPFPSMICNEPPPLDSEDEDSESFRDFPSAGLKLDILGEPSPQQSPMKSPLKKTVENGVDASKVSSPEDTPFQSPIKMPIIENGVDEDIDNFQKNAQVPNQSSLEKLIAENGQDVKVEDAQENPSVQISVENDLVENCFDLDENMSSEGSHCKFAFSNEKIENDLELSPDQSPFQSPFKATFDESVDVELDISEDSPVHNTLNEELFDNSLDNEGELPSPLFPPPQQSPNQSPLSEDLFENCQDEYDFTKVYSTPSIIPESNNITQPTEKDLIKAQDTISAQPESEPTDDDFGDFEAFQSSTTTAPIENSTDESVANNNMKTSYIGTMEIEDEEFGNFEEATFVPIQSSSSYLTPTVQEMPSRSQIETLNFNTDNDNFGDFEDFQSSSFGFPDQSNTVSPKVLGGIESKLETLIKSVFNLNEGVREDGEAIVPLNKELNEEWRHVQDFEGSQGLQFKWSNCAAHQRMLHSLKIDTTAVMYTGKWGTIEVPRFAASIVESPLQPKVYSNTIDDELLSSAPTAQSAHEAASSRENVSKNQKSQSGRRGQGSSEAQQILDQLPDLSFMRAKTLVFASQIQE